MANGTFQLELVSPERLLLSRQVEMAVIPSAEGEMGVLPGHAPMIVALRGGVISVRENGAESERLFVAGGFAEVLPDRCTVLADEVTPVSDLSRAEAERRLSEAEAALAEITSADTPERRDLAMARVQSARAMRDAAGTA
jgi:F-type H+-transporting ATPase subunit epsilon